MQGSFDELAWFGKGFNLVVCNHFVWLLFYVCKINVQTQGIPYLICKSNFAFTVQESLNMNPLGLVPEHFQYFDMIFTPT